MCGKGTPVIGKRKCSSGTTKYHVAVAAAILAAVEPGFQPGGIGVRSD
jgi:hypothetical protein